MTKRKLHVGTWREWRKVLKRLETHEIKIIRRRLESVIKKDSLSFFCPFPNFSCDEICHTVFPEIGAHCPCHAFYVNEIKTFVESILKEKW